MPRKHQHYISYLLLCFLTITVPFVNAQQPDGDSGGHSELSIENSVSYLEQPWVWVVAGIFLILLIITVWLGQKSMKSRRNHRNDGF